MKSVESGNALALPETNLNSCRRGESKLCRPPLRAPSHGTAGFLLLLQARGDSTEPVPAWVSHEGGLAGWGHPDLPVLHLRPHPCPLMPLATFEMRLRGSRSGSGALRPATLSSWSPSSPCPPAHWPLCSRRRRAPGLRPPLPAPSRASDVLHPARGCHGVRRGFLGHGIGRTEGSRGPASRCDQAGGQRPKEGSGSPFTQRIGHH